jgi:hypothetical protein
VSADSHKHYYKPSIEIEGSNLNIDVTPSRLQEPKRASRENRTDIMHSHHHDNNPLPTLNNEEFNLEVNDDPEL